MSWLLQLIVIWLSLDILIIATGWYAVTTLKPYFPNWWKRTIADVEPDANIEPEMVETLETPILTTKVIR
jgi:hypothetical protein